MIDGLKPYPEYKSSNLPWLGKIPKHWDEKRAKFIFREVEERSITGGELRLAMSQKLGLVPHSEIKERRLQSESFAGAKLCRVNDIVMNRLKAHLGVFAIVRQPGIVSPDYTVFRPIGSIVPEYYEYLLKGPIFRSELIKRAKGIIEGFWRLYTDDFYDIRLPVPPIPEQKSIVECLHYQDQFLGHYLRSKHRFIDLLNEQKQAIISHAVMRGIDPNVRLKPSGIEWFGDVPEHWKVIRLRDVANLIVSNVDKKTIKGETPIRLCNYVDVYKNDFVHKEMSFMHATATESEIIKFRIKIDDVIITKDSEEWQDIGVPSYVTYEAPDLVCGYHLAIIRPYPSIMQGRYLHWQLMSDASQIQFSIRANGVTRYGLSYGGIKEVALLVPPLNEQSLIVRFIDDATSDLNHTISDTNHEISLLKEYHTRLISDIVTGKVDVHAIKTDKIPASESEDQNEEFEDNTVIDSEDIDQMMD